MNISDSTLESVKAIIVKTLGIEDRASTLNVSTPLLGSVPELDSFSVVELAQSYQCLLRRLLPPNEFIRRHCRLAQVFQVQWIDRRRPN